MKKAYGLLAGVTLMAMSGSSPVLAASLNDVLAATYESNPNLSAYRAKLRATDEGVPQALSGWRPTVTVTGAAGRGAYYLNTLPKNDTNRSPKSAGLNISQPIYSGGRTVAATDQAEAQVLAERARLIATEQTVLLSATNAYLNVVRDEEVLNLSINNEQVLRRQLEATQERFRVGEITRTDVSQAEARLAKAVADRIGAEGTLKSSRANYLNNVGALPDSVAQPALPAPLPGGLIEATAAALANNPNVVAADRTFDAAKSGVDLVFGELLPKVSVDANVSWYRDAAATGIGGYDSESTNKEVLLNLSVPLYEGGGTYSRLRAAKETAGQRRIEADQARRDAIETASKAWESLQSAQAQVTSYNAQIKASDLALAGVREESKVGSRTVLDVLNAEQEVFDARVSLVRAVHDQLLAAYQLKSAVGEMTAQGLNLPVQTFDPVQHYQSVREKWIGTGIGSDKGAE
ncbi:TolC family outer membrane protein [Magnetospirillum molischianum]|uniref:Putative outer membrane protein tolC n=1 Tax=Magnetospirillum molischianum DSM 120 TaxID=1150626 RepID=H8FQ53_MAGML|nr:TolC family outer membrane protein [Magnetospirillum molischianum]CCG40491.1 putative outer membrane protein tolC precursor [Magnetospirillum molischianum DSM 120]